MRRAVAFTAPEFKHGNIKGDFFMGIILLIILVVLVLGGLPSWGYSRNWGYGPSGGVGLLLLLVLILVIVGTIPFGFGR
jgi:hypothetical protein